MYIQLFETNREAVRSALATFFAVFPNGTIWGNPYEGKGHDLVLLGQRADETRIDLDAMEGRFAAVTDSLAEVGMYSPTDLFGTYAGRAEDLQAWLKGAAINRDDNLRMQYLAGLGLNRDDADAIYEEVLRQRQYPEGLFSGSEGRMNSIRLALLRE
jgi:spermidine synthase